MRNARVEGQKADLIMSDRKFPIHMAVQRPIHMRAQDLHRTARPEVTLLLLLCSAYFQTGADQLRRPII